MSDVVNRMQGNFGTDRDHYMKSLMRPDLLILDDLGAERNTSFGKERVFDVVDKRRLTGKPMIVTTNIPLSVMKQAADCRIFDRILEVCVPIRFDGENFRKGNASANIKKAAENAEWVSCCSSLPTHETGIIVTTELPLKKRHFIRLTNITSNGVITWEKTKTTRATLQTMELSFAFPRRVWFR